MLLFCRRAGSRRQHSSNRRTSRSASAHSIDRAFAACQAAEVVRILSARTRKSGRCRLRKLVVSQKRRQSRAASRSRSRRVLDAYHETLSASWWMARAMAAGIRFSSTSVTASSLSRSRREALHRNDRALAACHAACAASEARAAAAAHTLASIAWTGSGDSRRRWSSTRVARSACSIATTPCPQGLMSAGEAGAKGAVPGGARAGEGRAARRAVEETEWGGNRSKKEGCGEGGRVGLAGSDGGEREGGAHRPPATADGRPHTELQSMYVRSTLRLLSLCHPVALVTRLGRRSVEYSTSSLGSKLETSHSTPLETRNSSQ
eukprot:scaffold242773_cov31-Tisochrysis_lutea.AAC.1